MNQPSVEQPLQPPDPSAYDHTVWDLVRQIPTGRVATYGQIGALIPTPPGVDETIYQVWRARWVGDSLSRCPADVPWQRVLNSQGKISLTHSRQQQLLEAEGVVFNQKGRIDLKHYQWSGPDTPNQLSLF